jgi:WD40 repeat protein
VVSARTQIERLRTANSGAADLATLCSLAVLVEPELLRRLRLLLPGVDITAESDLWSSELLAGASSRGIALDPLVADELRADLRLPRWSNLRTVAWQHIADCHRSLHWSLRLEEQINRHVVDGAGPEVIEPLLLAAVGELSTADRGSGTQVGIARWLIGALARLPRLAAATDASTAAGLAAGLHLDGRVPTESAPVDDHWLPWLLSTVGATRVRVPVRFAGGVLEVNPASSDIVPIEVPRTQPMVLDVDWHDGRMPHSTRLTFTDTPASCSVHADEVTLTTLAGAQTRLSRTRTTPAGLDFTAQRTHHRPYFDRHGLLDRAVRVVQDVPWTLLTGSGGTGKTALACAIADRLERQGWLVAQHFYGVDQAWDDPEVVVASLDSQLRTAFPDLPRFVTNRAEPLARSLQHIDAASSPRVLLLIDGVPNDFTEESFRWLFGSSPALRDVRILLTIADARAGWIESTGARQGIDLDKDTYEVCAAILKYHDPALRDIWDTRPTPAELISLAGDNPGHLTRIIDWLLTQPPASATLDRIPRSLTVHMARAWRRLTKVLERELLGPWLAALAVARDNLTVDDAMNLANLEAPAELLGAVVDFGLVHVDGSLDDGASVVTAEPSLAAAIDAEFGPHALLRGHVLHSAAFPMRDVGSASRYQISSAMHHFAHADRMEILELPVSGEFLRRRACQDGVSAVLDDLHTSRSRVIAPVRRAAERIADIAARHPDRFVELLVAEMRRQGDAVPVGLVGGWPSALVPRWVRRPPGQPTTRQIVKPVTVAAWLAEVPWFVLIGSGELTVHHVNGEQLSHAPFTGVTSVVVHDEDIAVATGTELSLIASEDSTMRARWRTKSPITALGSVSGRLVAGTRSGVILLIDPKHRPRHLVGHGNAITATAEIRDRLLSASLDGTVRIWDLSTGSLLRTLRHRGPVRHVLGLGAQDVVTADDTGRVHWWNPNTGAEVRRLRGHDAPVTALHNLDRVTVMSAAADGTMWLWHRFDPGRDRQLTDAGPAVVGAVRDRFTKKSFLTWDDKGRVIYWNDAGTPTPYHLAGDLPLSVRTVFPGPEGYYLVHAGGVLTIPRRPKENPIASQSPVAVAGRDEVLLGMPNGLLIHDTKGGWWRWGQTGEAVVGLAAAGDGVVLMAREGGTADYWPVMAMRSLATRVRLVAAGRETEGFVDEDGNLLGFLSGLPITRDAPLPQVPQATALTMRQGDFLLGTNLGEVMLIGAEHEPIVATVPTPVTAVAEAGKGWCVIGTSDGTVYRWHPEEPLLGAMGRHDGPVAGLAAAGNRFAASTSADGTVRLWDVLNGAEHAMVAGPEPCHGITFHGPERLYARSGEDGLWCLDLLATDTARGDEGLRGVPLFDSVISVGASVPFEIRAVQPLQGPRFGGTGVLLLRQEGESLFVGRDGRLAVPWRFSEERDVQIGVESELPLDGVRVAYVTLNRRDERWLTIDFNEETQA